jgi:hypothetical protein
MRAAKRPKRRSVRVVKVKHRRPKPRPAKRSSINRKRKPKMTTTTTTAKHDAPSAAAHADKPHELSPIGAFLADLKLRLKNSGPMMITEELVEQAEKLLGGNHKK